MSTTQTVAALYRLQQLDLELERLVAEQQAVMKSLQGNAKLQELRVEHDRAQQQLRSSLQAQKEAEWVLEDLNRRLAAQEQRLYSGMVSNPKELNALQQEIQHLRTQQGRQEDTYLEVMEVAEALQEETRRKAETIQQMEEAWTRESATILGRRDQLEVRKQELQARRTQMLSSIDAGFISRYEAMRRAKQGRAISKVEQNSCQWCRV